MHYIGKWQGINCNSSRKKEKIDLHRSLSLSLYLSLSLSYMQPPAWVPRGNSLGSNVDFYCFSFTLLAWVAGCAFAAELQFFAKRCLA
jgi:hypothetical protein